MTPIPEQSVARLMRHRATIVWLVLVTATVLSWWLGTTQDFGVGAHPVIGVIVIGVGFLKGRYIGLEFMELRNAPLALRGVFEVWIFAVYGWLAVLFLIA